MKRVYHSYEKWEDYLNGMYRDTTKEEDQAILNLVVPIMQDHKLFGSWMMQLIEQWPVSCEHNLTCTGMNRRAWVGQASMSLAIDCPEHITKLAWWKLTKEQQDLANMEADKAVFKWEESYRANGCKIIPKIFQRKNYNEVVIRQLLLSSPNGEDTINKGVRRNEGANQVGGNQSYPIGTLFAECA